MARTATRTSLALAVPFIAALALTACTSNDTTSATGDRPSATPSSGTPTRSGSASASETGDLVRAGRVVLDRVGSGTVISVEREDDRDEWEVTVITADGTEHTAHVAEADASVRELRSETPDSDDRLEDRRRIDGAELDYAEAADRVTRVVAGEVTELGLDEDFGKVVWKADVRDADGMQHDVRIDAGNGDTVTDRIDSDD